MARRVNRLDEQLAALGALDEPLRRALYLYVGRRGPEVSRDQAARALRVSRALAAFHLERLTAAGLLRASFRRLTARRGPGAGRPSKLYSRAARQLAITLPERQYELAARLLARAVDESGSRTTTRALARTAREHGRELGARTRARAGAAASPGRLQKLAVEALRETGYEPEPRPGGTLHLRNCPFEALTSAHRQLVCGMNLELLQGMVEGLGHPTLTARLDPAEGRCCVLLSIDG